MGEVTLGTNLRGVHPRWRRTCFNPLTLPSSSRRLRGCPSSRTEQPRALCVRLPARAHWGCTRERQRGGRGTATCAEGGSRRTFFASLKRPPPSLPAAMATMDACLRVATGGRWRHERWRNARPAALVGSTAGSDLSSIILPAMQSLIPMDWHAALGAGLRGWGLLRRSTTRAVPSFRSARARAGALAQPEANKRCKSCGRLGQAERAALFARLLQMPNHLV